ncbi:hypothetical protein HCA21_11295 [Listeria seeligeri]|uniref:hypothetical protein n=1 Tax=Listeria seeligeri TaxID=1640 RepID=UPI001624C602|nr:hypothetical protein [Listeria seeligeri]MBC1850176.1 hypothetical protein [Listeria seeligeri]MBC1850250.1 hypothetical protein [Listeria seeligeri]MBF2533443.1 hypothetical protein [Listeria seeligeri]
MENNYMFEEINNKENEIKEQLEKWNCRNLTDGGCSSRGLSDLLKELAELERLSYIKIMESEEK